jgi:hypothetical protein
MPIPTHCFMDLQLPRGICYCKSPRAGSLKGFPQHDVWNCRQGAGKCMSGETWHCKPAGQLMTPYPFVCKGSPVDIVHYVTGVLFIFSQAILVGRPSNAWPPWGAEFEDGFISRSDKCFLAHSLCVTLSWTEYFL